MDLPGQLQPALGSAYRIERQLGRWGIATVYRGQAAEGLGNLDLAKTHYDNVVRWWRHCDPELVPPREEAREALARLLAEPAATRGTQ